LTGDEGETTYYAIMSDQPDNLIVRYLRRIDEKVDRAIEDLREIKQRLSSVEAGCTRPR